eukprot:11213664-Lingulodinium_polyedra.AAC.1
MGGLPHAPKQLAWRNFSPHRVRALPGPLLREAPGLSREAVRLLASLSIGLAARVPARVIAAARES